MGRVDWHNATRYSTTKLISACENYVTMLNFTGLPEGHGNKTSKSKSDALNSSPSMCPNPASMDLSPVTLQVYKAGYPPCFLTVVKHLCSDSHHAKAPYDCRFGSAHQLILPQTKHRTIWQHTQWILWSVSCTAHLRFASDILALKKLVWFDLMKTVVSSLTTSLLNQNKFNSCTQRAIRNKYHMHKNRPD